MIKGELRCLRHIAVLAAFYLDGLDGDVRNSPAKDSRARWDALMSALRASGYYPLPEATAKEPQG